MTCSIPVLVLLTLGIFAGIIGLTRALVYFIDVAQERTVNIFFSVIIGSLVLLVAYILAAGICGVTL